MDHKFIADIAAEITVPKDGILSRTLVNDDHIRLVVFGFAEGQELTEHTSKMAAVLYILEGEAKLKLGNDETDGRAGTWVRMAPHLPHGIKAKTDVKMVLILIKAGAE